MINNMKKRIKILEMLSAICAIVPAAFLNMTFLIIGLCIGLIIQIFIFSFYKKLGRQNVYLKNKLGALLVSFGLFIYILLR